VTLNFCAPCLLGLEGLVGDELRRLGFENARSENGRVRWSGEPLAIARANINLRCAERVLIEVGSFEARSFDSLFEGVKALPWEDFIPKNGAFPVKGHSLNSQLHSVPDCQRIIKKAVAERLKGKYCLAWLPEDGELYQIQFALMKDVVTLYLDTSGTGLHKRGYRPASVAAPLRETLAAAMVWLARYKGKGDFCDPFCGSGTIAIEAALAAKNRAPGLNRSFSAEKWSWLDPKLWKKAREEARDREFNGNYSILGSDIDPKAVEIARQNALRAGVADIVKFHVADATAFSRKTAGGVIVTNPPYGERLLEKRQAEQLYREFGSAMKAVNSGEGGNWKLYILSSHEDFERFFGRRADKKRKLYNGMIKCQLFMYYN
jgi:putative N6-adenine-specific DNA methylase